MNSWLPFLGMSRPELFSLIGGATVGFLAGILLVLPDVKRWKDKAQHWFEQSNQLRSKVAEYVMRDAEDAARDERIWRNVRRELHNINREGGIAMELAAENDAEAAEAIYAMWCAEEKPLGGGPHTEDRAE